MSSVSTASDAEVWARIGRVLATIPLPENRGIVMNYLQERKAIGIRSSTLMIDANALRGFCLHLDERSLQASTRQDGNWSRSWQSLVADGRAGELEERRVA